MCQGERSETRKTHHSGSFLFHFMNIYVGDTLVRLLGNLKLKFYMKQLTIQMQGKYCMKEDFLNALEVRSEEVKD